MPRRPSAEMATRASQARASTTVSFTGRVRGWERKWVTAGSGPSAEVSHPGGIQVLRWQPTGDSAAPSSALSSVSGSAAALAFVAGGKVCPAAEQSARRYSGSHVIKILRWVRWVAGVVDSPKTPPSEKLLEPSSDWGVCGKAACQCSCSSYRKACTACRGCRQPKWSAGMQTWQ